MKHEYKVFFALPFDALTRHVYEAISDELRAFFETKGYRLTTAIGNKQMGPSQHNLNIRSFKAQNIDLHDQFFKDIETSDIIIADLTNNNPNVHVELGIALALNKNILRVTGRDRKELGFDIQNLDAFLYKDKEQLFSEIQKYIERFIEIKHLDFLPKYAELYKKTDPLILPGKKEDVKEGHLIYYEIKDFSFRDGAVRATFEFLDNLNDNCWFGIYFRASQNPMLGSFLIYIRKNDSVELGRYPGPEIYAHKGQVTLIKKNGFVLEIENDELQIDINGEKFNFKGLEMQNSGNVWISTWECQAKIEPVELINRDTR